MMEQIEQERMVVESEQVVQGLTAQEVVAMEQQVLELIQYLLVLEFQGDKV